MQMDFKENRKKQKIFLLNSVIQDKTISDYGVLIYCYLKSIQRADMNYYPISIDIMDYYFTHNYDLSTRDRQKYVDGLKNLEEHQLIKPISSKKFLYEYDLDGIYFNPANTNKDNQMYFTVVYSDELNQIMQLADKKFSGSKVKLLRYYINVVSTFMKGQHWSFEVEEGKYADGLVGITSIERLSELACVSKDTAITYNKILEDMKMLCIYRSNTLKLIDNQVSGITNTYGRYKHRKYVIGEGKDHEITYGYDKECSKKHKTQKTTERKSVGAKYYYLVSGQKEYDEKTIIEIYRYAVEYNRIHEGDCYYEDKLKDLEFFSQYPFITDDCIDKKPKQKNDKSNWGDYNSMENTFEEEVV